MSGIEVNFQPPEWASPAKIPLYIDVVREGVLISQYKLVNNDHFFIGANPKAFIVYNNPRVSEFHAIILFSKTGHAYIMDLNSRHGTWLGEKRLAPNEYVQIVDGNRLRFGVPNSKRNFLIREACKNTFLPELVPYVDGSGTISKPASIFTQDGRLTQHAIQTLNVTAARAFQRTNSSSCDYTLNQDHKSSLEEILQHYINAKTGLLEPQLLRLSPMIHRLSPVQLEILHQIERYIKELELENSKGLEEVGESTEKKRIVAQVHILQDRLLQSAKEIYNNDESGATSLSKFMKESLDERLFDEEDIFFDRTAEWNHAKSSETRFSPKSKLDSSCEPPQDAPKSPPEQPESSTIWDEDPLDAFMRENEMKLSMSNKSDFACVPPSLTESRLVQSAKYIYETSASNRAISEATHLLSRINQAQQKECLTQLKQNQHHLLMNDSEAENIVEEESV